MAVMARCVLLSLVLWTCVWDVNRPGRSNGDFTTRNKAAPSYTSPTLCADISTDKMGLLS
eukprot:CAMPEP_0184496534 /NCGR_PEP_ID=MMETSP0113_2-20130426/34166_1 /TAXON_ID=91329 /ORGANISM="Norrisiella sphaerica, Strain BC52" /LENGTH=59 /DNA_ID=CAMNT_0026883191 /DNA_START=46 /DNA_END=222 /DNA_ORIENTATION=+